MLTFVMFWCGMAAGFFIGCLAFTIAQQNKNNQQQ
jgi:hypothetical protein